jgi:small-conductance mechanosensitive channel
MSFKRTYQRLSDSFDQERLLLLVMLVWSAYAIFATFQFRSGSAGRFPRLTGSAVLIGATLLLFRNYLPGPIQMFATESADVLQADEEITEKQEKAEQRTAEETAKAAESKADAAETEEPDEISTVGRPIHDSVFVTLLMTAYGLLGYAIGILWVTPVFVVAYGVWFEQPRRRMTLLSILAFAIAFGFMTALGVPIDRGELVLTEGVF